MIKKYNQYIKENIIVYYSDEIDPYGEEDWDDDELTPVLRIAKKQGKPYDQITYFVCSDNGLISLEGIENLINIKLLDCSNNNLTSLNEIGNLINLEFLYCWGNNLTNLNGVENLINLKYVSCLGNNFSNEYKQYIKEYYEYKKIILII